MLWRPAPVPNAACGRALRYSFFLWIRPSLDPDSTPGRSPDRARLHLPSRAALRRELLRSDARDRRGAPPPQPRWVRPWEPPAASPAPRGRPPLLTPPAQTWASA